MFYGMNAWFLATLVMGAHIFVAFAGQPGLKRLEPDQAARLFLAVWSRSAPVMTVVTAMAVGLGVLASVSEPDTKWAVGAGFLALALLFAAVVTHPLAGRLQSAAAAEAEAAARDDLYGLLRRWSALHLVRLALIGVGVFFFIWAAH